MVSSIFGTHGMTKVCIRNVADHLYHSQYHQQTGSADKFTFGGTVPPGKDLTGQITGNQRKQQNAASAECCKKHIHEKYVPVRLVIG
ncbi:hypothetical protein [Fournierella sp.]|uniref:hypothetical protein n=1 Tax=Allofournierella sp. TaxID=1940256 RepID=UPI00307A3F7C